MEGRRRKQQQQPPPEKKNNFKNPQSNIKELKKDIETFETQVNLLLEHVQAGFMDGVFCVMCGNHIKTSEYYDLPCQHILCETCFHEQTKNHCPSGCPQCSQEKPPFFHVRPTDSSSSSDDG